MGEIREKTKNETKCQSMLRVGTLIHGGVYRIESYLASGGFGNTYVVRNVEFDEVYAMKEFYIKGVCQRDSNSTTISVSNDENINTFKQQLEKFKKEARRLRSLNNPHIIKVYDLFEENGSAYYVMDYVDGESLATRLKQTKTPLSKSVVKWYLGQILDGLNTIHAAGILHLDIKPANIMVDSHDVVKLIDFGASKQQSNAGGATISTGVSYTNGYAPNEQMAQNYDKFGPWTDFYALGATLFKLLTNQEPPSVSDVSEDETEDKHLALPMDKVGSEKMKKLIVWMMQVNQSKRPRCVAEVLQKCSWITSDNEEAKNYCLSQFQSANDETTISAKIDLGNSVKKSTSECKRTEQKNGIGKKGKWVRGILMSLFAISMILSFIKIVYVKIHQHMVIDNLVNNMVKVNGGTVDGVTFSDFYVGKFEVTNEEYDAVMDDRPVYKQMFAQFEAYNTQLRIRTEASKCKKHQPKIVSRKQVQLFLERLNKKTGKQFRLPTDLEWEVAAKGGIYGHGYKYSGGNDILGVANIYNGKNTKFEDVGKKRSNELGIYDMTGNVDELCDNVVGSSTEQRWSVRGGCCLDGASESLLISKKPLGTRCLVGFRLALGNSKIKEDGYVDLGLSVKWAKCNLGAETPEESGDRFAWGETKSKEHFELINYKYWENPIGHNILLTNNDAAYVLLGKQWRMPTTKEMQELLDKCIWSWKEVKGVKGYVVSSKTTGKSIFLPGMMGVTKSVFCFRNGHWGVLVSGSIRTLTSKPEFYAALSKKQAKLMMEYKNLPPLLEYYAGYWSGTCEETNRISALYFSVSVENGTNSKPSFSHFFGYEGLYIRPVHID